MSVHGYKVDNAELQRVLNNLTAQQITKLAAAGEKAMEDISRKTIVEFYKRSGSSHDYSSLAYSLQVKRNSPRQNSRYVWVDIDMYIDPSRFLYATEDFYEIYKWSDRKGIPHPRAADFVIDLQWWWGVIGLPQPYAHLSSTPLETLMEDEIKRIWNYRVRQFL